MNLKQLHYFRVLANYEHYTHAATELCITQPSLSHAISELEKELGTYLFEKHGRNVRITKYGRFFLTYVEHALDELEKGEQQLRDLTCPAKGMIDLAFIYSLGPHFIPNMVHDFSQQDPHKNVSFSFHQGTTKKIIEDLKTGKFDLAFCLMNEPDPEIEFIPLVQQEMVVIVPYDHPLANYNSIDLKDTIRYPYIFFNKKSDIRPIIDNLFTVVDVCPQIASEVEEDSAIAGLVSVNYGIAIMPRILTLKHLNVKVLHINNPIEKQFIYLASVKDRYLSPATEEFRQFAIDYSHDLSLVGQ